MIEQPKPEATNRVLYMDALKGMSIIFVIYGHFFTHYLHTESMIRNFCEFWYMQLFFFISGFFFYSEKKGVDLSSGKILERTRKLLHPAIVVCFLYILALVLISSGYSLKETILASLYDPSKRGYWFTYSLAQVYLLMVCLWSVCGLNNKSQTEKARVLILLVILSSVGAIVGFRSIDSYPDGIRYAIKILSLEKTVNYIPFFILGVVCRLYKESYAALFGSPKTLCCCIIVFFLSTFFDGDISDFVHCFSSLFCVISLFVILSNYFTSNHFVSNYLIRIGRSSLQIYLIHFFVILLLSIYGSNIIEPLAGVISNPVSEFVIIGIMSICVAELVCFVNTFIKRYTWLHKLIYTD